MSHLVYIGAGSSRGLEHWLEYGSTHSVLLEPHPQRAERLRQQTAGSPSVTVVEVAVAARPNSHQGKLLAYTLPHASGLHEPKGLWPLFPGLRLLERYPVNVISAHQLVADYFPNDEDAEVNLVLHAPGEEHAILQTLMENDRLSRVARLHLSAFTTPVNAETPAVKQTLQDLKDYGFELTKHEDQDPDWQLWTLQLSDVKRQLISERQDFSRLRAEQEKQAVSLKQELAAAQQALTEAQQAKAAAEKAAAEKLQAAKAKNATLEQSVTELKQSLEAQHKQRAEQEKQAVSLKQELAAVQQALTEAQQTKAAAEKAAAEKLQAAKTERTELNTRLDSQANELKLAQESQANLEQERGALQQKHTQSQEKLEQTHGWFLKRKQQAEAQAGQLQAFEAERDTLAAENTQLKKRLDDLNRQLKAQQQGENTTQERFAELESKLDRLFGEQRSYIQQTTSALGQHVTRNAKQQRDEQALASYLAQGQVPFTTPLPADYALELLKRYQQQSYDVVIVMGSADTTQLLAHAACTERGHHPALASTHSQARQAGGTTSSVALSADDLPQAIVSLEHRKAECEALQQALTKQQHRGAVNVVHAPWVECQHQGQSALFYACAAHLERLNGWLEADARVLVVIGDALRAAGHERVAALPHFLHYLPTQRLELIMEGRQDAQTLEGAWSTLLRERQREAEWERLPSAISITIDG